jgi:hypothetical protein
VGLTGSSPGVLKLENGHLSFDAYGRGALTNGQLHQLEGVVSEPGLANRLSNDEVVRVFDTPLAEVRKVTFSWFYFGGGMKLAVRGVPYRFSFIRPQNTLEQGESESIEGIVAIPEARRNGKPGRRPWPVILSPAQHSALVLAVLAEQDLDGLSKTSSC